MSGDTIDWAATKRRLEQGDIALAQVLDVKGDRLQHMLRERARRLARPEDAQESLRHSIKVLVIKSGSDRYALALDRLAGVLPFVPCAPVPGGAPELIGVFNARGAIWGAFDLRRLLGSEKSAETAGSRVVLLRHAQRRVALRVDEADEIRDLAATRWARSSADAAASGAIVAVTSDGLALLNLDALWAHPSIGEAG